MVLAKGRAKAHHKGISPRAIGAGDTFQVIESRRGPGNSRLPLLRPHVTLHGGLGVFADELVAQDFTAVEFIRHCRLRRHAALVEEHHPLPELHSQGHQVFGHLPTLYQVPFNGVELPLPDVNAEQGVEGHIPTAVSVAATHSRNGRRFAVPVGAEDNGTACLGLPPIRIVPRALQVPLYPRPFRRHLRRRRGRRLPVHRRRRGCGRDRRRGGGWRCVITRTRQGNHQHCDC